MKHQISKIGLASLATLVVLLFTACNDNFDEGSGSYTYPKSIGLGMWTMTYVSEGSTSYTLNITLDEDGDTICDVTTYNPLTELANVYNGGTISYNSITGVMTAEYEDTPYSLPGRITLAFKSDNSQAVVQIYTITESDDDTEVLTARGYFNAVSSDTISVYGMWEISNGQALTLDPTGSCQLSEDGLAVASGTYTFSGTSGTATLEDGTTIALAINSVGQMYATISGTSYYAAHVQTVYIDDWEDIAIGNYESWLFGTITGSYLSYSECRKTYAICPFAYDDYSEITFYWNQSTNTVTFAEDSYNTYYTYYDYGLIYAVPGGTPTYESNVFTFPFGYELPEYGAYFVNEDEEATDDDVFTITDWVE